MLEGWYCVGRASRLRRGDVARYWIGTADIVLFRGLDGKLAAVDRACGHLGADLAKGRVVDTGLQCAFHAWCWDADGACVKGPGASLGRTTAAYQVRERWGLLWVWAGDDPAYELPAPAPENARHVLLLPEQRLAVHPHVMLGNGLDLTHVIPVHRFRFEEEPKVDLEPPHRLSVDVHARFSPNLLRRVLGVANRTARWRFTTIGPTMAWVRVTHPTPFELVWAARPLPGGGCASRTVFFLPRWTNLVRSVPMMVATTVADRRILEGVDFRPNFVPSDSVFELYANLLEAMPAWR